MSIITDNIRSSVNMVKQVWSWILSNDGSGSGLDADMVDGNHASAFASVSHTHSANDITSDTLKHEYGGLEADVSAFDGLLKISSGSTSSVIIETGTITPIIFGGISSGTGTYTAQQGSYIRIGNQVFFQFFVQITAHTGTGNFKISGLPYTNPNRNTSATLWYHSLTYSNPVNAIIAEGTSEVHLYHSASGALTALPIDTSCTISISGLYTTETL